MVWKASDFDSMTYKLNGVDTSYTSEEKDSLVIQWNTAESQFASDKLKRIREIRNEKLRVTDYLALSDNALSGAMETYRQDLRDIPQDYTDEAAYDLLLAEDGDGNLTHEIWSKP